MDCFQGLLGWQVSANAAPKHAAPDKPPPTTWLPAQTAFNAGHPLNNHPPRPRDHRDGVLRPHRRSTGAPALGVFRRELGLGDLRSDGAQPAASRGNTDLSTPRDRPGRDLTTPAGQRARTTGQTPTPTRPTTSCALALDRSMARAVEQHLPHHTRTTRDRVTQPDRRTGLTEPEKLDRPANHPRPR